MLGTVVMALALATVTATTRRTSPLPTPTTNGDLHQQSQRRRRRKAAFSTNPRRPAFLMPILAETRSMRSNWATTQEVNLISTSVAPTRRIILGHGVLNGIQEEAHGIGLGQAEGETVPQMPPKPPKKTSTQIRGASTGPNLRRRTRRRSPSAL